MKIRASSILPWLIPLIFIGLAAGLTIPWTYWVIQAAYDRDVLDNARMLARRVEIRILSTPEALASPKQASDALNAELASDSSVQLAVFCDLSRFPVAQTGSMWHEGHTPPAWTEAQLRDMINEMVTKGVIHRQTSGSLYFTVPWISGKQFLGFTYMELSRSALSQEFWAKEGSLVKRVVGLSSGAMLVLSILAILAFQIWLKAGRVQQRAELARQGLMAERGLTAAVLAHEIRNPLAALRFQLHSLRNNATDLARVTSTADTIDAELLRIQQLVTDYLEHERARSMRVQRVDLADAAQKLQTLLEELFRVGDTQLTVIPPAEPIVVTCDPHALRQILMNLVLNAQQAIKGRPGAGEITLRVRREDGFGAIDVTDNGPGIPTEMRERIFKPFQTTRSEGHGIGLALVKRFVDNFGGSVSVESELGCGATFHLRLPLAGEGPAETSIAVPATALGAGRAPAP